MTNIAQRIESLRTEKNVSRVEVASALGMPRTALEKFETGRATPTKEQQEKLAAYFGVSVMYLRGESDDRTDMSDWLSGNVPDTPAAARPVKAAAPAKPSFSEDGALFNMLLKSDSFKAAVLDILRSPEGEKLIAQAMIKQQSKKY